VIHNIDEEYLWPFSIPARTKLNTEISIANFGKSNKALFKEIYRKGLAIRYGKTMQSISGVHFNYSFNQSLWKSLKLNINKKNFSHTRSQIYFRTLRNIQRKNWLLLYLFGCSPIIGEDLINKKYKFFKADSDEYYLPYATSLRMSSMGYQNINQSKLFISLNDINGYLKDLKTATETLSKDFIKLDKYSQLSANLLQIEDEYYAMARPKSSVNKDLRQISKLSQYGVDYLELRSLDLNPYSRYGVEKEDLVFIEVFLLYCTFTSSPELDKNELQETMNNSHLVSVEGRKKELILMRNGKNIVLRDWAREILNEMQKISELVGGMSFNYKKYEEKINSPQKTLSGILLNQALNNKKSFYEIGDSIGNKNKSFYKKMNKSTNPNWELLETEKYNSINNQKLLEKHANKPFKEYLRQYYK